LEYPTEQFVFRVWANCLHNWAAQVFKRSITLPSNNVPLQISRQGTTVRKSNSQTT